MVLSLERVDVILALLGRAGPLYERCGDHQRTVMNQVAFEVLYDDMDGDGRPVVAEPVLNPEFETIV